MNYIEKEVTVGELRDLFAEFNDQIEIDTPDGWQPIKNWWDKGMLQLVQISCSDGLTTRCADNHLLEVKQLDNKVWKLASELLVGEEIFSINGYSKITDIKFYEAEDCFDFEVAHPNHRYWGDGFSSHNSGKSYLASGNIAANAQKAGHFVVIIDSENALDSSWLEALGVSTDENKLLKINASMIDDVAKIIFDFVKEYKATYLTLPNDERPKVLFIIDSLGMLMTPTDVNQFEAGDLKGDMGRKPKALNALVRNCVNMFGELDIGLVATNHSYASQDMFDPDPKMSGGAGFVYGSSIVLALRKLKLKEDEDGNKTSDVKGIRSQIKCMKTRFNKPFEQVELRIPFETGLDPYSGLIEMFEQKGLLVKDGNRLKYTTLNGVEHKYFRKAITNDFLDLIMNEFQDHIHKRKTDNVEIKEVDNDIDIHDS